MSMSLVLVGRLRRRLLKRCAAATPRAAATPHGIDSRSQRVCYDLPPSEAVVWVTHGLALKFAVVNVHPHTMHTALLPPWAELFVA